MGRETIRGSTSYLLEIMPRANRLPIHIDGAAASRFWDSVNITPNTTHSECWLWVGRRDDFGYGHFKTKGRNLKAHRVAWTLKHGPTPDDKTVDHICRNPCCVNPSHMALVSNKDNILRGSSPTARNALKTHCIRGHELAGVNIRMYRGRRYCLACEKARRHPHVGNTTG
jgi:hypothetical protein